MTLPNAPASHPLRAWTRRYAAPLIATLLAGALPGCGEDLGDCDMQAAQQLVYGRGGLVATKGQALMHDSCGNAAFCHSDAAKGKNRFGAPGGMDFDMLPPTGWPEVADRRDQIWSEVSDGEMPPGKRGRSVVGDGDWSFDELRSKGAEKLPALSTREGKAVLRNWLACGAPVVSKTQAPSWTEPPGHDNDGGGAAADWPTVYQQVIKPSCAISGCHNASGANNSGGLDMSDMCGARAALLQKGRCASSSPRVTPGDQHSLLIDKITNKEPSCGGPMPPPLGGLPASDVELVREWVAGGAQAPECK
jgi:hypothetical protein